ncbi:MAG: ABC transporter permease [Lachnospiraceae bacterium]|jgi:ABC-type dipeptide/oligopeptide/nickel transport system permease component|nr:ABC transporter permease [Lachnospiraceae bacterium]MCI9358952.1 ABC transporter permease [Lachnospiraceae bacterium]
MNHWKTTVKRIASSLAQTVVVLVGITLITFLILHISPGNPAEIWLTGGDANVGQISEKAIHEQEVKMGLDKPFLVQYGNWLLRVCQGDLGASMSTSQPVWESLAESIGPTMSLTITSLLLTILISVPLGIYCAVYKDQWLDNIVRCFSFLGISLPSFFISLILLWIFCLKFHVFQVIATRDWRGMVLPAAVLVIQSSSKLTRQIRAVVLEQLGQEYVKGAAARGVDERTILFSHVLKNCLVPILTWCSIYFGIMLGGSSVIETIFSWDGVGKMAVEAVGRLDYYMIQGFVLWIAVIFLAVNLTVDILSAVIDPRIKGAEK